MNVEIIKYTGPEEDSKDITIGGVYKVLEQDNHGNIYVEDNIGEMHAIDRGCFKVIAEQPPEYSGEGLPPVGTVCEILGTSSGSWSKGVIDYIDSKHCIWHWVDGNQETLHNRVFAMQFRPIKSEKDKEIEEIFQIIYREDQYHDAAEKLYEHGYRKTK